MFSHNLIFDVKKKLKIQGHYLREGFLLAREYALLVRQVRCFGRLFINPRIEIQSEMRRYIEYQKTENVGSVG